MTRKPFGPPLAPASAAAIARRAAGAWSRRITEEHRLVYLVDGEDLIILQARYHY